MARNQRLFLWFRESATAWLFPGWVGSLCLTLSVSAAPSFRFAHAQYSVRENETLLVHVEKVGPGPGRIAYATADGTARAGQDYEARQGALTFVDADASQVLPVIRTGNDFEFRGDRQFVIRLTALDEGTLADPATVTVTILDDDGPGPAESFLEIRWPEPLLPQTNAALQVWLEPAHARGQWRVAGDFQWRYHGEIATGLAPGNHEIEFRPIPGYWPLKPRLYPVAGGQTNLLNMTLYPQPDTGRGSLMVELDPVSVALNSQPMLQGGWRLPGETAWRSSGQRAEDLLEGTYELEFKEVPGYLVPVSQPVRVTARQTTLVKRTYLLAPSSAGLAPRPVSYAELTSTNLPYLFNGQIKTEFGWGSGVVVQERVVLTAAHVLFDDINLAYANDVLWMHQKQRGDHEPVAQRPRGWYVFEGYAAQRQLENSPGSQSLTASQLDVAAVFFVGSAFSANRPARSGYGGCLVNAENFAEAGVGSEFCMMHICYPTVHSGSGALGKMHSIEYEVADFDYDWEGLLISKGTLIGYGGAGGALYCKNLNGRFYPIGICVGQYGLPVFRKTDFSILNLVRRAVISSYDGGNSSGGGQILINPAHTSSGLAGGFVQVQIQPGSAVAAGAGWRIQGAGTEFTSDPAERIPLGDSGAFTIEFKEVDGYSLPTNDVVVVSSDAVSIIEAFYMVEPPRLNYTAERGLEIMGTAGTAYRIEQADQFGPEADWTRFTEITLSPGTNLVPGTLQTGLAPAFFRAVWQP